MSATAAAVNSGIESLESQPVELLSIEDLRDQQGDFLFVQVRAEVDEEVVATYAEAMKDGAVFPPIEVYRDGAVWWIAEGQHRLYAAVKAGLTQIRGHLHHGTKHDALIQALSSNDARGRTDGDKREVIKRALEDPELAKLSDRELAKLCHLSHPTVGKLRRELAEVSGNAFQSERQVIRGGKTYTYHTRETAPAGLAARTITGERPDHDASVRTVAQVVELVQQIVTVVRASKKTLPDGLTVGVAEEGRSELTEPGVLQTVKMAQHYVNNLVTGLEAK